jgi:hypothetical protein
VSNIALTPTLTEHGLYGFMMKLVFFPFQFSQTLFGGDGIIGTMAHPRGCFQSCLNLLFDSGISCTTPVSVSVSAHRIVWEHKMVQRQMSSKTHTPLHLAEGNIRFQSICHDGYRRHSGYNYKTLSFCFFWFHERRIRKKRRLWHLFLVQ